MAQWSKPVIIGAGSVIITAAYLLVAHTRKSRTSSTPDLKGSSESDVRKVTSLHKHELLGILEAICSQMGQVVIQLVRRDASIRRGLPQSAQLDDQLKSFRMAQFETAIKAIERQVYAKFEATEDEVKTAITYYNEEGDADVINAIKKLQELYHVTMRSDPNAPDDLTLEKFLSIMNEIMESLNVAMEEVCLKVKKLDPDNKKQAIHEWYEKRVDELSAKTLATYGLSLEALQTAMLKFMHEPAFLSAFAQHQEQQAQRFAAAVSVFNGEVNLQDGNPVGCGRTAALSSAR